MKILYIAGSYDPHIPLWVKYFAKRHEVYIFSDKRKTHYKLIFPENVTIIEREGYLGLFLNKYCANRKMLRYADMLLSARRYAKSINKLIARYDIDIVHAHSLYYGYLASFIDKGLPVVFTPMGSDVMIHAQRSRIHGHLAKRAFARADVVTSDSRVKQKSGYKLGAKKDNNFIIQYGVDDTIFSPRATNIRQTLGIAENTVLLLSPRGIAALYNLDDIIRALGILRNNNINFKCIFKYSFGDEYLKVYKRLVKELNLEAHVIWIGYIDHNELPNYYNAADIVISVPSSDSSPKSVYEAMLCGKPVIASDLPWCHEHLTNDENILITGVNNPKQLANNVMRLISDPDLSQRLGSNSIKKAKEIFSYEKNAVKMEDIMNKAVEKYGGRMHA